jgi:hypothetical protein
MSAVPPIADKRGRNLIVRYVPFASFAATQKNRVSFCISDEQPYSTRLWERAPSTTSIADIDRRLSHLSFWPCVELTRLSSDLIWNQPLKLALVNFKGECSILAAFTAKGG